MYAFNYRQLTLSFCLFLCVSKYWSYEVWHDELYVLKDYQVAYHMVDSSDPLKIQCED